MAFVHPTPLSLAEIAAFQGAARARGYHPVADAPIIQDEQGDAFVRIGDSVASRLFVLILKPEMEEFLVAQ